METCADSLDGIDVLEWQLPVEVLETLLKDRTTGRNIVWATKDYERLFGVGNDSHEMALCQESNSSPFDRW